MGEFHIRTLPFADEATAIARYRALVDEGRRWTGAPREVLELSDHRATAWEDLEIHQMGRGIMVLARTRNLGDWWSENDEWSRGDPMGPRWDWVHQRGSHRSQPYYVVTSQTPARD